MDNQNENIENKPEKKGRSPVWEWVKVIIIAVCIALIINFFIIVNSVVPSGSMENTIMTGSRMIGLRLTYIFEQPSRGDVIIFKYPDDPSENFVKRIIGLPGDTVEIIDGITYVNGEELDETEYVNPNYYNELTQALKNYDQIMETADEITKAQAEEDWEDGRYNWGPYEVPEESYFVMGDNRNNSSDSRYWTTTNYVPRGNILGKAIFVYFPFNRAGAIK